MRFFTSISFLLSAGSSFAALEGSLPAELERRGCNSDNCLRDLKAPKYSVSASAYCSSLLRPTYISTISTTATAYNTITTVTPQTTATITTTTSTTIGQRINPKMKKAKRVTSSSVAIPAYASDCKGAAAITSACSCFLTGAAAPTTTTITTLVGLTTTLPATSTAPTSTATATVTATTTVGASCPAGSFTQDGFTACGSDCDCQTHSCSSGQCTCATYGWKLGLQSCTSNCDCFSEHCILNGDSGFCG